MQYDHILKKVDFSLYQLNPLYPHRGPDPSLQTNTLICFIPFVSWLACKISVKMLTTD